jgi:hypothetical protein
MPNTNASYLGDGPVGPSAESPGGSTIRLRKQACERCWKRKNRVVITYTKMFCWVLSEAHEQHSLTVRQAASILFDLLSCQGGVPGSPMAI